MRKSSNEDLVVPEAKSGRGLKEDEERLVRAEKLADEGRVLASAFASGPRVPARRRRA